MKRSCDRNPSWQKWPTQLALLRVTDIHIAFFTFRFFTYWPRVGCLLLTVEVVKIFLVLPCLLISSCKFPCM
jgi:hypothetical protein